MKIKKIVACMLVTVLMITFLPQAINVFAHENSENRVNYLVVAKNESSYNVINQEYKTEFCEDKTVSADSMVLSLTESEAESIEEYAGTEYIEKDILFNESTEDDSTEDLLSDFLGIDTEEAEEVYPDNILMVNGDDVNIDSEENIVVGILDSGIANHDDLNVTKRVCLIPDMHVDNNLFSYDLSGHGTGVAGVIGAKNNDKGIIGIYENVELYSIQVLTPTGQAPLSRIVAGIDWAIENGVDVLNMSFGTNTNSEILYDAIVKANNSGMILVAAAGNTENATQYPAKYNEVISVGSVDGSGNISDFSAKDSYVDIYAPGESVQTTTIVSGYTANNGTSLAAPHVTAAAALIKAKNSQRTTADIKNLISATANKSVEGNEKGIIDIENMLTHADDFDYTNNQTTYQNTEPFDEYDQDAVVVGSWSATRHQNMTANVYDDNDETWKQNQQKANILACNDNNNFRLMIAASYLADMLYGTSVYAIEDFDEGGIDSEKVTMHDFYPLHALGHKEPTKDEIDDYPILANYTNAKNSNSNYVANTKYLFRLAKCYMDYTPNDGDDPTAAEILEKIRGVDEKTTADVDKEKLKAIVRSSDTLYWTDKSYYFDFEPDGETLYVIEEGEFVNVKGIIYMDLLASVNESNACARAFKILGLAIHLAGDAYAHKTQVPISSTYSGGKFHEDNQETRAAFSFEHDTSKNDIAYDMEIYLKYKHNKNQICTCFYCFKSAVASGRVETIDIANFIVNETDAFDWDKPDLYRERYTDGTRNATFKLIELFLDVDEDFSITTFIPMPPTYNYTLKLNNLKGYIIGAGVDWSKLETSRPDLTAKIELLSTSEEI